MITNCKEYECNICNRKEIVEEGFEPNDIVSFEIYNLKPCICRRCLKLAINAASDKNKGEYTK
jgi:hypothetical protein